MPSCIYVGLTKVTITHLTHQSGNFALFGQIFIICFFNRTVKKILIERSVACTSTNNDKQHTRRPGLRVGVGRRHCTTVARPSLTCVTCRPLYAMLNCLFLHWVKRLMCYYRTQRTAEGSVFGAVCVWNISGTVERICAKFTRKTCLIPRSDEFEGQGQTSRSPETKTAFIFGPFGSLRAVYVW